MNSEGEWRRLPLKSAGVTLIDCDHKTPEAVEDGYPYIAIPQLKDGHIKLEGVRRISKFDYENWTKKLAPQADDVIVVRRCNSGQSAHVPAGLECAIGQNLVVLRADGTKVLPKYLRWLVRGSEWWSEVGKYINVGAVFDSLRCRDIPNFELPIPPLAEQRKISSLLGALDDRMTLLRETNATLEAIAQALFKSWFIDFDPVRAKIEGRAPEGMDEATAALFPDDMEKSEIGMVPRGWNVHRLGDITERITKGTTPTTLKRNFVEKGINFVKAESMDGDGSFLLEKFAFIDDETHTVLKRSQLASGDVLISIAGTIGRTAMVTDEILPANTNQAVAIIRPRHDIFPGGLIWRFLNRIESRQTMNERIVQAVQANLSLSTLSDMKLVTPPAKKVETLYQTIFAPIDQAKNVNNQKIRLLSSLRDMLLPRLISGQMQLPDVMDVLEAA